jgi:hypothetical protein
MLTVECDDESKDPQLGPAAVYSRDFSIHEPPHPSLTAT